MAKSKTAAHDHAAWTNWGPYLSERAWGNLREDYDNGEAWDSFPFEQSMYRAYRWSEDGLGGLCNRSQDLCLALALWNEQDALLKERLFGLSNPQGNHGEDLKEYLYYLDATPDYRYLKMLYRYPQVRFPYERLILENGARSQIEPEFELIDALRGEFENGAYFDIFIEYAKAGPDDILCQISAVNRSAQPAPLHILPHLWYRNTWAWGDDVERPQLRALGPNRVLAEHPSLGQRWWAVDASEASVNLLFTENDTNRERAFGQPNETLYVKDSFHAAVVEGQWNRVNPEQRGTKCCAHVQATVAPGATFVVRTRFSDQTLEQPFADFETLFERCREDSSSFYAAVQRPDLTDDERRVQRQAFAGLLWSKQFYHFDVGRWLDGDPNAPAPKDPERQQKNATWRHLQAHDVLSLPDKWEYPWFAAWDLAFQVSTMVLIDPEDARHQILLLLDERYMHPTGPLPAFEADFQPQNPPVHAWAAWHIYCETKRMTGQADQAFLERVFHKLLVNYTWWVNCIDPDHNGLFGGGFLGMDNISVIDRNELPVKGFLDQADGTGWMVFYALTMFMIALELAQTQPVYEDTAIYFAGQFQRIAHAIRAPETGLWDEKDGFFYDVLRRPHDRSRRFRIRSYAGLVPALAAHTFDQALFEETPRLWAQLASRDEASSPISVRDGKVLFSVLDRARLERILNCLLDPDEFLSDYGIRSLSKIHLKHPVTTRFHGKTHEIGYEPGDAQSSVMGGNSNWRGPIWAPLNTLIIEALRQFARYYGDTLKVQIRGYDHALSLDESADDICRRLIGIFLMRPTGDGRPLYGDEPLFNTDPQWNQYIWFYEHFHADKGHGLGANHQNGWTALIARLIQDGGQR